MLNRSNQCLAAVLLAALFCTAEASGQSTLRQSRLATLQQQNALLQQQNAVQVAVQQATSLLQSAKVASQQGGTSSPINLQQLQIALQIAIQQTTAMQQASYRQNNALGQLALRQLNTLQSALQQTTSLQDALPSQSGKLTTFQLQLLSQEQTSLMGLLTAQIPPVSGRQSRTR